MGPHPAFLLTAPPACQVNTQMCSERASLAQVVRQEFAEQLAASQEETQRVKVELAELQARQQVELDEVHRRWVLSTAGRGTEGQSCLLLSLPNKQCSPRAGAHMVSVCVPGRLGVSPGRHLALGLGKTHMCFSEEVGRVLAGTGDVQQRASGREGDSSHPESP